MQTWKQYREMVARNLVEENGCTLADARYSADSWRVEWDRLVAKYAQSGQQFTAHFLNTVPPIFGRYLAKHWPTCIPAGYVWKDCRAAV